MIYINQVTKTYESTDTTVLSKAQLHIKQGQMCFLLGNSGAGKTTLLELIHRDLLPDEGQIVVNGVDITSMHSRQLPAYRQKLGMVFQDFRLISDRTVFDNVAIVKRVAGAREHDIRKQVASALKMVDMDDKYSRFPAELSGGEQQRVGIARAIVNNPYVILADEPTGNLDPDNAREIMLLLERINQHTGATILIATHNMQAIEGLGHRRIRIEKKRLIDEGE